MKKIMGMAALLFILGLPVTMRAQVVKKTGKAVEKGAESVGDKTAEVASKGKSAVVDERYKDKVGPHGQTIYIDHRSKYYWIDKKGHKQYISKAELRDKHKK
jgi:hypothetical protein